MLAKLAPVFPDVDGQPGMITAGTSSGITDGGAAVVLMGAARASALGVKPLARVTGWASAGVDPRIMGIGPVPAMRKLFERTGLTLADFDLFELNEAFAPQVLAVLRDEPIPADKLNVNGGAIALGHPIGCTGTRILVTLLYEMQRRGARRGLATLCVSGGMGMAMAVESLESRDQEMQREIRARKRRRSTSTSANAMISRWREAPVGCGESIEAIR